MTTKEKAIELVVTAKFNEDKILVKKIPYEVIQMYEDLSLAIIRAKNELINYCTGVLHVFLWSTSNKNKEEAIQEFELFKKMPAQSCYVDFPKLKKREVCKCECDDIQCSSYEKTVFIGYSAEGLAVLKKPLVENPDDIEFEIEIIQN